MTKIVTVTGLVPYFGQSPISYIALDTLPDAYHAFDVEVSFKPEALDGLILYNGQVKMPHKLIDIIVYVNVAAVLLLQSLSFHRCCYYFCSCYHLTPTPG